MGRPDILLAKPGGDNPLTDSFSYSQRFYQTTVRPAVCWRQSKLYSVVIAGLAATSLARRIGDGLGEVSDNDRCKDFGGKPGA